MDLVVAGPPELSIKLIGMFCLMKTHKMSASAFDRFSRLIVVAPTQIQDGRDSIVLMS